MSSEQIHKAMQKIIAAQNFTLQHPPGIGKINQIVLESKELQTILVSINQVSLETPEVIALQASKVLQAIQANKEVT